VSNECCQVQDNTPQISSAISERLVIARWVQDKTWWLLQMLGSDQDIARAVQDDTSESESGGEPAL